MLSTPVETTFETYGTDWQSRAFHPIERVFELEPAAGALHSLTQYWLSSNSPQLPIIDDFWQRYLAEVPKWDFPTKVSTPSTEPNSYYYTGQNSGSLKNVGKLVGLNVMEYPAKFIGGTIENDYRRALNLKVPIYQEIEQCFLGVYRHFSRVIFPFRVNTANRTTILAPIRRIAPVQQLANLDSELLIADGMLHRLASKVYRLESMYGLTGGESRVVEALALEKNEITAAKKLGVSVNTLKFHRKNAYSKLTIHRKHELIRLINAI